MKPELVLDDLYFPECLRWHANQLWFSDMLGGSIYTVADGAARTVARIPGMPGGLGWLPGGELLAVDMAERTLQRIGDDGRPRRHADLSSLFAHTANDMYVDTHGRAFVGTYGYDIEIGAPQQRAALVVVEPDGTAQISGPELLFANGIVQLPGSPEIVVSETFADQVSAVRVNADGSSLGERRTFAEFPRGDGPDGLCLDGDGGLWVACAYGAKVVHVTSSGAIDREVSTPVPGHGVPSCVLGGPDGTTLFMAVMDLDEEYAASHRTGSIFAVEIG